MESRTHNSTYPEGGYFRKCRPRVFLSGTHLELAIFSVDSRQEHAGMTEWVGFETASREGVLPLLMNDHYHRSAICWNVMRNSSTPLTQHPR